MLQNNEVAAGIFLIIGILMNMPFPICAIIGGIYGAFAVTPWYTPALQVIILEIAWFILNLFFTLVMGTSIGTFSVATKLLDKLEWINFRGVIGRKQFFIRLLIIFVTMILIGLLAVMIDNEITVFLAIIGFIFTVLALYSTYAKRLHDLGMSGVWCVGILLFNILTKNFPDFNFVVSIIIICAFCFIKGDKDSQ